MADPVLPWPGENTPEALDAEYNLRTRHPEREEVYADFSRRSELVRSSTPVELDVSYGSHERTVLDLFPASGAQAILVFFHGGYWRALDKSIFSFIAAPYVKAGYAVAMPNYPLAPETPIGGIVDQALAAVTWIGENRGRLGAHADAPIVVTGHSAGGHLAAICAATDWTERGLEPELISACVPISGLFDLEPLRHTNVANQVHMTPDEARRLSPMHHPHARSVRTVLAVGGDETDGFLWQSRAYQDRLAQFGTDTELREERGFNHFTILGPLAEPDHPLHRRVLSILEG